MYQRVFNAEPAVLLIAFLTWMSATAWAQQVPFVAQVNRDIVPVRAGAGRSFYVVSELSRGSRVTVEEVVFGWYKIKPPEGTYSYISRAFVDAFGDGKVGKINANRAAVRAASVNGAAESYRRQIDLLKGDRVKIISEDGSFYRIVPPDGAYVFLPPGSIDAVENDGIRPSPVNAPSSPEPPAIDPTVGASTTPTTTLAVPPGTVNTTITITESARPVPEAGIEPRPASDSANRSSSRTTAADKPDITRPNTNALEMAEQRLVEAQQLPLEQRPIGPLMQTYQQLAKQPGLSLVDSRIIAMRLAQLRRQDVASKALQELVAAQRDAQAAKQFVDQIETPESAKRYDLRGQLMTSAVYNGSNLPRLYRITETDGQRIIAYARLHPSINPAPWLGQYVGIIGQMKYDPALKLEIIEVDSIDPVGSTAAR